MAAAHGMAGRDIAGTVERTAKRLEIDDLLERRCGELSRGQRQRVAIGQALVHAPPVLLLDEPAAGLDPEARHALAGLFRRLQGDGMTLLVSSHILAELDEYCTHMLVLRAGRLVEHRALGVSPAAPRRQVRLSLTAPAADLAGVVGAIPNAQLLESDTTEALLEITGDDVAQAGVLRALVERGVPVCAFSPIRENLHASYLRTVGTEEAP
jgi:ABC-2 type transport system ATP-binding protein